RAPPAGRECPEVEAIASGDLRHLDEQAIRELDSPQLPVGFAEPVPRRAGHVRAVTSQPYGLLERARRLVLAGLAVPRDPAFEGLRGHAEPRARTGQHA